MLFLACGANQNINASKKEITHKKTAKDFRKKANPANAIKNKKGSLIGFVNKGSFTDTAYKSWFNNRYKQYNTDKEVIAKIKKEIIAVPATKLFDIKFDLENNENIALVNLNAILTEANVMGINFDGFNLNTNLVTGGAISLDGIHLTARGYAFMANKFLEAIDTNFGSNFIESGNIAKAGNYPTNYSPTLK